MSRVKGATTVRTSGQLANDPDLMIPCSAGETYAFEALLFVDATAEAELRVGVGTADPGDARAALPDSTASWGVVGQVAAATNAAPTGQHAMQTGSTSVVVGGMDGGSVVAQVEGTFRAGASGFFGICWCQNNPAAPAATLRADSRIEARRVG